MKKRKSVNTKETASKHKQVMDKEMLNLLSFLTYLWISFFDVFLSFPDTSLNYSYCIKFESSAREQRCNKFAVKDRLCMLPYAVILFYFTKISMNPNSSLISLNGEPIENTRQFKYLGHVIK